MTKKHNPGLKAAVEYGPLIVLFVTYLMFDLIVATGTLMVATIVAVIIGYVVEKRIAMMPLITGVIVLIFGGLTVALQDETFIKMKPTIVQSLFAVVLFGGLALRRPLLKPLFGSAWQMDDVGWTRLTRRFVLFFIVMALLNELVWRTQSTEFWVSYKVFGSIGLTIAFTIFQLPLIKRHQLPLEE